MVPRLLAERARLLVPGALVAGVCVQAVAILGIRGGPERQAAFVMGELPRIFAQRVAGPALMGDRWFGELWLAAGWAVALFAAPLVIRGTNGMAPRLGVMFGSGARYVYLPMVLSWVPLLLLIDRPAGEPGRTDWRRLGVTGVAILVMASSAGQVTQRGLGPSWPAELGLARSDCAAKPARSVNVLIAPDKAVDPWSVRLPCDRF